MNWRKLLIVTQANADNRVLFQRVEKLLAPLSDADKATIQLHALVVDHCAALDRSYPFDHAALAHARDSYLHRLEADLLAEARKHLGVLPHLQCAAVWSKRQDQAVLSRIASSAADVVLFSLRLDPEDQSRQLRRCDWDLIRQCPVPVWLVQSGLWSAVPKLGVCVDVGVQADEQVDAARLSDLTLDLSAQLLPIASEAVNSNKVQLIHACEPVPSALMLEFDMLMGGLESLDRDQLAHHRKTLAALVATRAQANRLALHVESGTAESVISAAVAAHALNLLVLGVRKREADQSLRGRLGLALEHLFMGSVSERLLHRLDQVDLLFVP